VGFPLSDDVGNDLPIGFRFPGRYYDADGKDPEGIGYGLGSFSGILPAVERKGFGTPLTLAVDIDAADLVYQRVPPG